MCTYSNTKLNERRVIVMTCDEHLKSDETRYDTLELKESQKIEGKNLMKGKG